MKAADVGLKQTSATKCHASIIVLFLKKKKKTEKVA